MNIEEIMKPYFDKKEEINDKYIVGKNVIKLRLERLRDNKEKEIEEYVKNSVSDRPDFYVGYGAMVRKDLEQAYAQKEAELENQLRNNDKFYRVDVRELVEIKDDLRKSLISARKELEFKLRESQINIDTIMLKLSRFEYQYDANHNVLNGDEYRRLFEQSNYLIEVKYNLEAQLKKIEEYIGLTELTQEEIKVVMMSMTPWEKEEYDRRKNAVLEEITKKAEEKEKQEKAEFINKIKPIIEDLIVDLIEVDPEIDNKLTELINKNPELARRLEQIKPEDLDYIDQISSLMEEYPEFGVLVAKGFESMKLKKDEKQVKAEFINKIKPVIEDLIEVDPEIDNKLTELINKNPELARRLEQIKPEDLDYIDQISSLMEEYPEFGVLVAKGFESMKLKKENEEENSLEIEETPIEIEENEEENSSEIEETPIEIEENEEVVSRTTANENEIVYESVKEAFEAIFLDVMDSASKLRSIKLSGEQLRFLDTKNDGELDYEPLEDALKFDDSIKLPNGIYLNNKDISRAFDNYRKQNKGRTFKVKGLNETFEVNRQSVRKVKKSLRDCSIIKLLREKKLGLFDIKRVYGKEKADKYNTYVDLGKVKTKMPTGKYINLNDFTHKFADVFVEKSPSWIERITQNLKSKFSREEVQDAEFRQIDETNTEEVERENVRSR